MKKDSLPSIDESCRKNSNRIIVKVGTNVLTKESGEIDDTILKSLVEQISALNRQEKKVILVSSGAVGAGKSILKASEKLSRVERRQVYSSIGQIKLMNMYGKLFAEHHQLCAQVLATKEDFRDRRHYFNMKTCFESLFKENVVPIVNENDVVSVEELMFTDNDELAGLIGGLLNVDTVIILSNIDGLFDQSPTKPEAKIFHTVDFQTMDVDGYITPEKSLFGRGGMLTKCRIAKKLSALGITTYIANGKKENIILDIMAGKEVGTKFLPSRKASNLKRRIAYANGYEKGIIYINEGAEKILTSKEKTVSLLPIGMIEVEGEFEKGDIIRIRNQKRKDIGLGVAQYNSIKARQNLGQKNEKPFIRYDYLFLEL